MAKSEKVEAVAVRPRDPERDELPRGAANPLEVPMTTEEQDPVVLEAAKRGYVAYAAHHGYRDPRTGFGMETWERRTKHEQDGFYNATLAILTRPPAGPQVDP
jgi:hypothetical protein